MPSITLSVHLNQELQIIQLPKEKVLSYQELIRYLEFVYKDVTVNDYDMYINDKYLIYNNDTLFDTLNVMKYNHIDIYLRLKNDSLKKNNIPVIKPTVLRWTDNLDNLRNNNYHHSMINENNKRDSREMEENDTFCNRKDSGISLNEEHEKQVKMDDESENQHLKKKQRVMSADQSILSRQLPQLSPPSKYNTLNNINNNHHHYTHHSIHPLEMRRPSTAPSSPSYSRLLNSPSPINIKLPALSSITSSPSLSFSTMTSSPSSILENDPLFHTQLAPLQSSSSSSSPQKSYYHYYSSSILSNANNSSQPSTSTININKKSQQKQQSGQFLCEHVLDTTTGRICGQTFRRSYDLSRHQTIHLKNRPFCYCDQCGKKFTRMDALRRHERVQGHTSKQHILHRPDNINNNVSNSPSSSTNTNSSPSSQQHIMSFINNPRTIQQTRV